MLKGFAKTRTAVIGVVILLIGFNDHDHVCEGLQYQPVEIYGNNDECALILDGPGRTSVFDYTYNLLRGNFPPTAGSQTCITYDAVNHAYIEARKRINVARPKNEIWRPEDLATVGELLLDVSINLAQTYGLSFEEIEKSLPLIDTSKTLIREVCPAFLSNVECRAGKYRRYDGLCTNLQNPTWGSTLSPFTRLMPPRFSDGLSAPRIAVSGRDLPLSRIVSRTMHPDEGYHDHAGTVMVIAWGQFMDHDYTLTGTPLDPLNRNDPEECCSRPPHLKNPYCNEIRIPEDDYFYRLFNVQCMDFVRAFPAVRPGCRLGSRVPFNLLTGVLDGNTVYGITENFARKLRSGYGGLLRMNPVFNEYGLKDLLPLKLDIPDEGCTRPNKSMYCFEAGEIRVNEQLVLTCMHTLVAREHNRIAKVLTRINPHWNDETLFQESRRIVIAEIQHITYNEFLPILLGKDVMEKFGLLLEKNDYWDGYDPTVNPGVIDAFAAAAFRFGHSLLPTAVERWSKAHKFIASKRLSDLIRRPYDLYRAGVLDEYFMGLMNQVAQAMDDSITQEVTNHLFKKVGAKFGMDLVSFNMQRGREFGIPSYMDFRKYCGLPEANTFDELFGSMPNETIGRYSSIFEHPADVDLWSGGVSERPLPGSMLGPTFACIIATQFSHSRRGDRFWYELPNQPASFTLDQLNEIRKTKLAKMICDNTDLIDTIQIYPMVLPDHEINPRVPCRSGVLPSIDLSKWAEYPTSHATQYHQQSRKTNQDVKNVLPKRYAKLFNSNLIKGIKRKDKYVKKRYTPLLWTKLVRKVTTIDVLSLNIENNNMVLVDNKFKQSSNNDVIKISSIIEKMMQKNRGIKNARKRNQSSLISKRLKRSVNKNSNSLEEIKNNSKLYRNPKLTQEDEKSEITDTNANVYTDFYKRIWKIINGTRPTFKIVVPPTRTYREIFKDKHVTSESEIEDLNLPHNETGSLNERKKSFIVVPFDERKEDEFDKYVKVDMENVDNCSALKPIVESKNEKIIINPDIIYNSDEVYVDSKETKDLSENKKSSVFLREPTVKPFVESKISKPDEMSYVNSKETEDLSENKSTDDSSKLQKYSLSSFMPVKKLDNNKLVPPVPDYDPDKIPYVEIPDYSDEREESLDEEDRRRAKERYIDPKNSSSISNDDVETVTTSGYEYSEKNNNENANKDQNMIIHGITNIKLSETSNHAKNLLNHSKKNNENVKSQSEVRKNPDERFIQSDIQFDINEYNKPFDLDDFLKNEPFFQKFKKSNKNNNNNNKRDNDKELVDDAKSNYSSMSEDSTSGDLVDADEWEPRYERANQNSHKDHMKFYDDYTKNQGRTDEMINEEKDFLDRYFSKDVIDKLEEDSDEELREETKRKEKEEEKKQKTLKTLSMILDKKDRISRLDEKVNKEIEDDGKKVPSVYKNYWSLEYELPGMKDMKRDEENIN